MEGGDSEFANFTLPTLKAFWRPVSIMRVAISNNLLLMLLGNSGGVVNSLDFCLASPSVPWLLLLLVHTFFTMEGVDSEFANFTLPTLNAFFWAHSHNVSGNKE